MTGLLTLVVIYATIIVVVVLMAALLGWLDRMVLGPHEDPAASYEELQQYGTTYGPGVDSS